MFTNDDAVIRVGADYIRIMSFIQWAYVMSAIHISYLQAVKRPMYGFVEAVVRKVVLPLIVFSVVVYKLAGSLETFWYSLAVVNLVMTIITICYAQMVIRKMK